MKKMLQKSVLLAIIWSLCVAGSAMALPILTVTDGTNTFTQTDADLDGLVVNNQTVGQYTISVQTGTTKPLIGSASNPHIHLNSLEITTASPVNTSLTITFEADGFGPLDAGLSGFLSAFGGTTNGTVSLRTYYKVGAVETDLAQVDFTPTAFSDEILFAGIPASNPFVLGIEAIVTHYGAGQVTSFDADVSAVPEPGTLVLLGSGLIGLAYLKRRKKA